MFDLFSDGATRTVFETVIGKKRADLRAIREELGMPEDNASAALKRLVDGGLLDHVPSAVPDFSVYFPSARGLAAGRQLNIGRSLSKALP